jgi:hypothetical protein
VTDRSLPSELERALSPGEVVAWSGIVTAMGHSRRAMAVTDARILLADPDAPAGWIGIDIVDLARLGVLLPRDTLLTIAARTSDELLRLELRPVDPPSFADIVWPAVAQPLIDEQFARSERARLELRRTLVRVVVGTIAGLTLLLVVLTLVLLLA